MEIQEYQRVRLRDVGEDERWLQKEIAQDPSILGLGDLRLIGRERAQSSGGRLDFLLEDSETEVMYEAEVMLGEVDESHIIRTIEYWDIECRRYPNREHRAVIVAEEITSRFFNVIWLLNRSLPIIALQLSALVVNGKLLLHFTKVLDVYEPPAGEDGSGVTKEDWIKRRPEAMRLFDRLTAFLAEKAVRVKPNFRQDGIALAGAKGNFASILPRKTGACLLKLWRLPESDLRSAREKLESAGAHLRRLSGERFSLLLDDQFLANHGSLLADLIAHAAEGVGDQ